MAASKPLCILPVSATNLRSGIPRLLFTLSPSERHNLRQQANPAAEQLEPLARRRVYSPGPLVSFNPAKLYLMMLAQLQESLPQVWIQRLFPFIALPPLCSPSLNPSSRHRLY